MFNVVQVSIEIVKFWTESNKTDKSDYLGLTKDKIVVSENIPIDITSYGKIVLRAESSYLTLLILNSINDLNLIQYAI